MAACGGVWKGPSDQLQMLQDVALCRQTGWTLDYVRSLDPLDKPLVLEYWDVLQRAEAHQRKQQQKAQQKGGRG